MMLLGVEESFPYTLSSMPLKGGILRSIILYFLTVDLAYSQFKFVDLAYSPFNNGPPNAGFVQVYLTGSSSGWPGETAWYTVCATTSQGARKTLSYAACMRYGYTTGSVHDMAQSNAQIPCADFSCPGEFSNLADCAISIDKQRREKKILYLICYHSNGYPLGQHPSDAGRWSSFNCDFENGDACGWDTFAMSVYSGGSYYLYDATLGTADGHVLAQNCPTSWSSWSSGNRPVTTEAVLTSPWLGHCLGYTRYCFTFSSFAPLGSSTTPTLNISLLDSSTREIWSSVWQPNERAQWSVTRTGFAAAPPFRIRIRTNCFRDGPLLFLDDFILATGECPATKSSCYNFGKAQESNYGDKFCECQNGWTVGKGCELTLCGRADRSWCHRCAVIAVAVAFTSMWLKEF